MRIVSLLFFLVLPVTASADFAASGSVAFQKETARRGLELLMSRDYDEMERFLREITQRWPDALIGRFGWMAYYQIRNLENYDNRFDPPYLGRHKRGRSQALNASLDPETTPWELLMAGSTLGVSGFYYAHNRRWLKALRDGSRGVHVMERAHLRDGSLKDALLGMGLHDYWRSHFTRKLLFLPFFADRRPEGRAQIERAAREGIFVGPAARVSLAFIDFMEKKYDRVLGATRDLLSLYPRNLIIRMLEGDTFLQLKRYEEARRDFETILKLDPAITKARLYLGLTLLKEGKDLKRAEEELEGFLKAEPRAEPKWRRPAEEGLAKIRGRT